MIGILTKWLTVGVVAGAILSGASAAAAAPDDKIRSSPDAPYLTTGVLHMGRQIELGIGKKLLNVGTASFELLEGNDHKQLGLQVRYWNWDAPATKVAYPIKQSGVVTDYWVQIHNWNEFFAHADCEIFSGEPGPESEPVWDSPFQCVSERLGFFDKHWLFTVSAVAG